MSKTTTKLPRAVESYTTIPLFYQESYNILYHINVLTIRANVYIRYFNFILYTFYISHSRMRAGSNFDDFSVGWFKRALPTVL